MKRIQFLLIVVLMASLSGCSNPMGISDDQWESLSPAKRAEYTAQQAQIDTDRRAEQDRIRERQRAEQAAREQTEKERITNLYQNAKRGDIVQIHIKGGAYKLSKNWGKINEIVTTLVRGELKELVIMVQKKKSSWYPKKIWLEYAADRSYAALYLEMPSEYSRKYYPQYRILLVNDGKWSRGKSYKKNYRRSKYKEVKDLQISVRYRRR